MILQRGHMLMRQLSLDEVKEADVILYTTYKSHTLMFFLSKGSGFSIPSLPCYGLTTRGQQKRE